MKKIITILTLVILLTGCGKEAEQEFFGGIGEEECCEEELVVKKPTTKQSCEEELVVKKPTTKQSCEENYSGIDVDVKKYTALFTEAELAKWNKLGCNSIVYPDCNNLSKVKVDEYECVKIIKFGVSIEQKVEKVKESKIK